MKHPLPLIATLLTLFSSTAQAAEPPAIAFAKACPTLAPIFLQDGAIVGDIPGLSKEQPEDPSHFALTLNEGFAIGIPTESPQAANAIRSALATGHSWFIYLPKIDGWLIIGEVPGDCGMLSAGVSPMDDELLTNLMPRTQQEIGAVRKK